MQVNQQRLLDRFLQYVAIDTTANFNTDQYPSSAGQLEIGKLLVAQLQEMGIRDASQDSFGVVMGTVPGNCDSPVVAFNSHVDTSPETTGKNVKPEVINDFDGQDVTLPGDPTKIITSAQCPELALAKGKTIVTTDGTTLLGGDDKAGVAIIMELANLLMENPDFPRGPVRVLFTCDEEIGRGTGQRNFFSRHGHGDDRRDQHPPRHGQGQDGQRDSCRRSIYGTAASRIVSRANG